MKSFSDFERCGFDEAQIIPFLAKHGINIGELSEMPVATVEESFPEWKGILALHPYLTETEAAFAFADIDPESCGWLPDDHQSELSRWKTVIDRAARTKELVATDLGDSKWGIDLDDLAAWCSKVGWPYPLPGGISLPGTDAGLRDALTNCDRERAQWKAKAETLEAAGDQRGNLQAEINHMRGELRFKADEIATLVSERDTLKTGALAGKQRNTALRIIGGLAMKGYGMDIHGERLERIGEVVKDLQAAGADVAEKTLREWLKDASEFIDPPKRKN